MSIIRIGLSESANYGDGWDAIFSKGTKSSKTPKPARVSGSKKKPKPTRKKK